MIPESFECADAQREARSHKVETREGAQGKRLLVAVMMACAMLLALPSFAYAANNELAASGAGANLSAHDGAENVVTIDFGSKHAGFVQKWFGETGIQSPVIVHDYDDDTDYSIAFEVSGSEVGFSIMSAPGNVGKAKFLIEALFRQQLQSDDYLDAEELFVVRFGKKQFSEYASEEEYRREAEGDSDWIIPAQGVKLHAFWAQPVGDFEMTVKPLTCGTTVEKRMSNSIAYTVPRLDVSVTGNAQFDQAYSSNWVDDSGECLEGEVVVGKGYNAKVRLTAKFGYYFTGAEKVTIANGEFLACDSKTGDLERRYANVLAKMTATHDWGEPSYAWSSDDKTVTATHTCKNEACKEAESETVDAKAEGTNPTCTTAGKAVLTATFTKAGFEAQTKIVEYAVDPDAHDWGSPTYTWLGDNSGVMALRVCKRNASHVQFELVNTTKKVTKTATATAAGACTYTANFKASWAETQTKKETIAKLAPDPAPVLLAKAKAKGKKGLNISWSKTAGAERYLVYLGPCGPSKWKKVETLGADATSFTKSDLKANTVYKAKIVAQAKQGGKWKTLCQSSAIHVVTGNKKGKYTNATALALYKTSMTLEKGKTAKLSGLVQKAKEGDGMTAAVHTKLLRFKTSNKYVAAVSAEGVVMAMLPGTCKIYVQTSNGLWKTCKVTVK